MDINRKSGKRVSASQRDFATAQSNEAAIRKPWKSLAAVAFGLLLSVPGLTQAQYRFSTIDVPGAKATELSGNSTNAIVGQFVDKQENTHGFVLNNGSFTTIDVPLALAPGVVPGVVGTSMNGINTSGQLVGTYVVKDNANPAVKKATSTTHAFFENKGDFITLDPLNVRSQGGFINTLGQVVGTYRDNTANQKRHGFIWRNGTFTTLNINAPGDHHVFGTVAFGINDFGEVVGNYVAEDDPAHRHGFLRSSTGDFTTFDARNAVVTIGEGINNDGTIVGVYTLADGALHGFVLKKGGAFTTVDVPDLNGNAQQTEINSINTNGEIVGFYIDSKENGTHHGFLGVPVH